jgi:cephalosporin hydroxylase
MLRWQGDSFRIDEFEYVCRPLAINAFPSEPGRFCLLKPTDAVDAFEKLLLQLRPRTIVEVGMYDGASTAFFQEVARPTKIVGFDGRQNPSPALTDFIERRHLGAILRPYYNVDQRDARRLREVIDSEFGGPVDLVVDDASHLLHETRQTFNALFPKVAPGGTYVIEDWWWAHAAMPIWLDEPPLTILVFELLLASAYEPDIVASVTASRDWAQVIRGPATLDEHFDLSACYGDRGRALLPDARRATEPDEQPSSGLNPL